MSGTRIGGEKTRDKNLAKNPLHYSEIGAVGGSKKHPNKGMASDLERASVAGSKGGRRGRKGYIFVKETALFYHYTDRITGERMKLRKKT